VVIGQASPFKVTEDLLIKYGFEKNPTNPGIWEKISPIFLPRADLRAYKWLQYEYNVDTEAHTLVEGTGEDFPYAPDAVSLARPNSEAEFLATLRALKFINL